MRSDPDAAPDPTVDEVNLYAFDANGVCTNISSQPGVTITIVNNVVTFSVTAAAAKIR